MAVEPVATSTNPLADAKPDRGEREPTSWDPVDLLPVLAGDYSGPQPDILSRTDGQTLLYPGRVHWLHGEPETGKSWFAIAALGEIIEAGLTAVLFDFEDTAAATVDRLRRIGVGDPRIFGNLRYVRPDEPLSDVALGHLKTEVLEGVTLVVIDATTPAMALDGLDPISTHDTARWLQRLPAAAANAGAAVLVLDHVVKAEGERGRWAIGSQAKLAIVTGAAFSMTARQPIAPGVVGRSSLTISKDRPGGIRSSAVGKSAGELVVDARDPDHLVIRIEPPLPVTVEGQRPSENLILSVLPETDTDALGWRAIGDRLAAIGHPLRKSTILEALSALVVAGVVDEATVDGRGSKVFWTVGDPDEV